MADLQYVKVSIEDRTAILTIDHPPANAFNTQTVLDLAAAFEAVSKNPEVKTIIITGAGQFFVAGADINEIAAIKGPEEAKTVVVKGHELFSAIEASPKPVIAAINGRFCLGGGNELAMACHIRLAEDGVRFGQPEINLGIIPGWGGTQRFPRYVGKGKALELLLTGDMINAQEAKRIGLVNNVVPVGEVVKAAKDLAKKINSKGALAVAAILRAVNQGMETTLEKGLELEADEFSQLCATEDMREGVNAFLQKRQPRFQDR
ncbi:MAG: enoyl-CoA hydratase-related protein [Anaerolineae bacterium]|nr:enoyl-CoA hydratase-related protein [Anaerolineae bacterium]